jgi:hypothetical protein
MLFTLPTLPFVARLFGTAAAARPRVMRRFAARVQGGAVREISAPPGRMTVHCRGGEAWITHDGDPRDVFLKANETYVADTRNRMTVYAMRGDCVMEIQVDD